MTLATGDELANWAKNDLNNVQLGQLPSWDAVIECARRANAITKERATQLRSIDWQHDFTSFVSPDDPRVRGAEQVKLIPAGAIIAFISVDPPPWYYQLINKPFGRRHIIHSMVSLGGGLAAGTKNEPGIGIGSDNKWEVIDLAKNLVWRDNNDINAVTLGIDKARPLRIRYRKLEDFQTATTKSSGGSTRPSIADLSVDLMKRVSIVPMKGTPPNSSPWDLITLNLPDSKLDMVLVPSKEPQTRGAWKLTAQVVSQPQNVQQNPSQVYFLPFASGRIVKLEIGNECQIFATTELTGCSIFTKGDRSAPTIYHAGFDGSVEETALQKGPPLDVAESLQEKFNLGDEDPFRTKIIDAATVAGSNKVPFDFAIKFWRILLSKLDPSMENESGAVRGWSEVNKSMYVNDETISGTWTGIDGVKNSNFTTSLAKHISDNVMDAHIDEIEWSNKDGGMPWGSYLGFYQNGEWTMYLQCNITFSSYTNKKTKKKYSASFPIALMQVYPRGQESKNLISPPFRIADPFTPSNTVVEE